MYVLYTEYCVHEMDNLVLWFNLFNFVLLLSRYLRGMCVNALYKYARQTKPEQMSNIE